MTYDDHMIEKSALYNVSNRFGIVALPQHSDLNWELPLQQVLACNWMTSEVFLCKSFSLQLLFDDIRSVLISFSSPALALRDIFVHQ